jgi:cell division protein FtsI/penicillin-binding protein 2
MKFSGQWRIYFLFIITLLIGGTIVARLFSLQILQYNFYNVLAQNQHQFSQELFPERGEIFIQDLKSKEYLPLVINKEFDQIYAIPKLIPEKNKEDLAQKLSSLLDLNKEVILERISKPNDPYEPLKHKVDKEKAEQIRNLQIKGIELAKETWRYYPLGSLASHLVGFVGLKDDQKKGQYGLEDYYENELKGQPGFLQGGKDTFGSWIPTAAQEIQPARDGSKLILTIDQNIQFRVEKELEEIIKKWSSEQGTIIVMEPKTGAIRALANLPNFNPNEYSKVQDINIFLNTSKNL